jgi:thiamine-monophosphate kinase
VIEGMEALAARTGTTIAGGDVVAARSLVVTVAVTGWADEADSLVYRDGAHLARRSEVTVRLRLEALPLARGVAEVARASGREPAEFAATAGDDYELLFAAPAARRAELEQAIRATGGRVTWIGEVDHGDELELVGAAGRRLSLGGYEHL